MECLDANAVQDLMAGALDAAARTAAIGHLDGCTDCRGLLGALARDAVQDTARDALLVDPLAETRAPGADPLAGTAASSPHLRLAETTETGHPDPLAATTRPTTAAGTQLGRYTQLERLGAGAMGVVYRAEDGKLGRRVALKLLKRPDPELTTRLEREARAMAQVTHPNVVAIYEVGVADGATYIAMELVEGTSLRGWQGTPRSIVEILEAYAAAGRGLAAAHAAGIVHRDFKPDNVLVGTDGRVRVTDFGLAAARPTAGGLPSSLVDVNLTSAGTVLGTPAYMAPEQFTGGNVDPRTDQFNFCVALYAALYGTRPFAGKSFPELGDNVCDGRMTPPPARSRVSSALRAIVVRGLSVKPGDRFPTMDHLLAELGRDRARPWRLAAIATAAIAAGLALWLVADVALRARAEVEIGAAFRMLGRQTVREVSTLRDEFYAQADIAYHQSAVRKLAGHHDLEDFGLGGAQADSDDLAEIHSLIESSDWAHPPHADVAILDAKGRLIYSTASATWGERVDTLPEVKRAIDTGDGAGVSVLAYDDPALIATHLIAAPRSGLAVIYDRSLSLGADQKEARAVFLEIVDGDRLLEGIKLDDKTPLALVAPNGRSTGTASAALVAAAPAAGDTATVNIGDETYQVQAVGIPNFDEHAPPVARVVMANPAGGLTLFPHARLVFLLGLLAALGTSVVTGLRARRMARA